MKNIRIVICLTIILSVFASFGGHSADAYYPDKPYDIAITFGDDALTEKNFTWITNSLSKTQAVLVVQEAAGGQQQVFTGNTEIVAGRRDYFPDPAFFNGTNNIFQFKVNKVSVTGLKPDTRYQYYCGDANMENWSDKYYFDTGVSTGDFTFLYMTDPQCANDSQFEIWKNCADRAYTSFPDAKFVMVAGDLTERGSSENYWDKFFK